MNRGWICLVISAALAPPMFSLSPALRITQYTHRSWTLKEGFAIPPVTALAQTADGYIWVGTQKGLFRFDDLKYTPVELPGSNLSNPEIIALTASKSGNLWISVATGLLKREPTARIVAYPPEAGAVSHMIEDHSGRLWITTKTSTGARLAFVDIDGRLRPYQFRQPRPATSILSLAEDRLGNIWIGLQGICRLDFPNAASCFEDSRPASSIVDDGDGSMLVADGSNILRLRNGTFSPAIRGRESSHLATGQLLRDRDGNIWCASSGYGLLRLRAGAIDRFTRRDGLASDVVSSLMEDREGTLWVGGENGMDSFLDSPVSRISTKEGLSSDYIAAITASHGGGIWAATLDGINRLKSGHVKTFRTNQRERETVFSIYEDPLGSLWAGTAAGVALLSGGGLSLAGHAGASSA